MVIGAGPNGLVAANLLAARGWDVVVLEAEATPGGAVRSDESVESGFVTDLFSAFYPLSAVSPVIEELDLAAWGLVWEHAPHVLAHATSRGESVILDRDLAVTSDSLDGWAAGDGASWARLQETWDGIEQSLIGALMRPFPPVRPSARLLGGLRVRGAAELLRLGLLPVRRFAEEHFDGEGAALLLGGNALHTDLTPETATSGFFGWMLSAIGQRHGWPVPRHGAGALTDAMVRRLVHHGGEVRCGQRVESVTVQAGRATGVRLVDGTAVTATHAVLADVVAPRLYHDLLAGVDLADGARAQMGRYQRASATFKVNWTLNRGVPWRDPAVRDAGTVHLADSLDELTVTSSQMSRRLVPSAPFVLVGQMTTADATRSPAGTESLWAYTSVPQFARGDAADAGSDGDWADADQVRRFADRVEQRIEDAAPGFRGVVRRRSIQSPGGLEDADSNLLGGDKSLGTAQLHQQLIFRPTVGWARPETPVPGLFLASASAHPGGGVHGACGANAARAALLATRRRAVRAWPRRAAQALRPAPADSTRRFRRLME